MKIIWYNADLKKYKFGEKRTFQQEIFNSADSDACTLLMRVESGSIAHKIIGQLNIASKIPSIYASLKY